MITTFVMSDFIADTFSMFVISTTVNVTFWDQFDKELEEALEEDLEEPIIMIIASAKINLWEDIDYWEEFFIYLHKH